MKFSLFFALISSVKSFAPATTNKVSLVLNEQVQEAETDFEESSTSSLQSRKQFLNFAAIGASVAFSAAPSFAEGGGEGGRPETFDVDNFLRTGGEAFPMGVSSQAGKSRPVTGVFLRDGTDVQRDSRNGNVLAEIVLGEKTDLSAVLVSFSSPLPLAKGGVFDVECRDSKTGDGAFLSVTQKTDSRGIEELPSSFFLDNLFAPTGRFSFYGAPTDLKVKSSELIDNKRVIKFSFANLSQSTNAEIPRTAIMVAMKPDNTDQAVMLVSSATSNRWKKGADKTAMDTALSFNASPSPKSSLKVRRREKDSEIF